MPPRLAFSPRDSDIDADEHLRLWKNQLREDELWSDAHTHTTHLLREIFSVYGQQVDDDLFQKFERSLDDTEENIQNSQTWLTIYDLESISQKMQDHHSDGPNDVFLQNSIYTGSIAKHTPENKSESPNRSWQEVITNLYNNTAYEILKKIYNKDASHQHVRHYLIYRAMRTMEQVKYFNIPFRKRQLLQLKQYHCKQHQVQTELERCYNDAFEKLDDYCMNVLGVGSDTLPLFPEQPAATIHNSTIGVIDEYAEKVARHLRKIMTDELEKISMRFISFLQDNREEISMAIEYHAQFTSFLSSAEWKKGGKNAADDDVMPTLKRFVTTSCDSLISQFTTSPSIRVTLVRDLQQLYLFLTSRKRELSSRGVGSGRDVVEAIYLAWTQHCITTTSAKPDGCNLNDLTLHDVSLYTSAVESVLAQIAGDSLHAKRLRLLADTLSCPTKDEALRFRMLCRRAANLSYLMSLYHNQQEMSALTMERCKLEVQMKEEELRCDTRRLDMLTKTVSQLI